MRVGVELLATCWTTAGDAAPLRGDEVSPHTLQERIECASAAGFNGIGLVYADIVRARDTYSFPVVRRMCDDAGIVHREIEFLVDWWSLGEARKRSDVVRRELLEAAQGIGAERLKVGPDLSAGTWNREQWATEFHSLCDDAEQVGCRVALEFMPFSNLRSLKEGREVVETAGHTAGGLMLDIWHLERCTSTYEELAALPLACIAGVEISDASNEVVGSLWDDTINNRRFCGEGDFSLRRFVDTLCEIGWNGPWGVEILSEELRAMQLSEGVNRAAATAGDALAHIGVEGG